MAGFQLSRIAKRDEENSILALDNRQVWGPGYITHSQYLRIFVAQLRKKIAVDANKLRHINTESGIGYRFVSGT